MNILDPVDGLSAAFGARDLTAALDWFVPDDDISYIGSEDGERADGRQAVTQLLGTLFARPAAYSWTVRHSTVHRHDDVAFVLVEAAGRERREDGVDTFPYRVSGLIEQGAGGRWLWRACQGSEPTTSLP